jgi:hypothetical protein
MLARHGTATHARTPALSGYNPEPETEQQAMARVYSLAGWTIFPLWPAITGACTCPKGANCGSPGKHPLYRPAHLDKNEPLHGKCKYGGCGRTGHGLYDATADLNTNVDRWLRNPTAGIGIPAQGNGFTILDIDPRHGGNDAFARLATAARARGVDLTATLAQRTGGGGVHYLFKSPPGGIQGGANVFGDSGIDIRGIGGYVVGPPSVHVSGRRYQWIDFLTEAAPWPDILTAARSVKRPATPAASSTAYRSSGTSGYSAKALAYELATVRATGEGNRNNRLYEAAKSLGQLIAGGELDREVVRCRWTSPPYVLSAACRPSQARAS